MMLQKTYFRESPNGLYNVADHFTPIKKTNRNHDRKKHEKNA
jgi:hypothetical protein